MYDGSDLLIGIERNSAGRKFHISAWWIKKQLATLGLEKPALLKPIAHGVQFQRAHGSLEPKQQTIVGIGWVVDPILVSQDRVKDSAHFEKMMPVFVGPRQAAHL